MLCLSCAKILHINSREHRNRGESRVQAELLESSNKQLSKLQTPNSLFDLQSSNSTLEFQLPNADRLSRLKRKQYASSIKIRWRKPTLSSNCCPFKTCSSTNPSCYHCGIPSRKSRPSASCPSCCCSCSCASAATSVSRSRSFRTNGQHSCVSFAFHVSARVPLRGMSTNGLDIEVLQ